MPLSESFRYLPLTVPIIYSAKIKMKKLIEFIYFNVQFKLRHILSAPKELEYLKIYVKILRIQLTLMYS
jgi:hypothetical protein